MWLRVVALTIAAGCSFEHGAGSGGHDGGADVPADVEIDATPPRYWLAASIIRGATPSLLVQHIDDPAGTCAETTSPRVHKALLANPSLPVVYGADSGFAGITIGCGSSQYVANVSVGAQRTIQRIAYDATTGTGFFTVDGPGALGVYRFTVAADGTPALAESANSPSAAGALTLDATSRTIVVAGSNQAASYQLGADLTLPASSTTATACAQPVDIAAYDGHAYLFCGDTSSIIRYTLAPFAIDKQFDGFGQTDRVSVLPGGRIIAARGTSDLAIVDVTTDPPTWTVGPTTTTRTTAMAASADGTMLATARQLDATFAEVGLWTISGQTLTQVSTFQVDGVISALALAPSE